MTCSKRCPAEVIVGGKNQIHVIDQEKCIKCEIALKPPSLGSVKKTSGEPVPPPIPEEERTIVRKRYLFNFPYWISKCNPKE